MTVKVLFVDDDRANLAVCEAACGNDVPVLVATSAESALEHFRRDEIGVVLADQRMPRTSGVELLERVRLEYPETVRILITAYSDMPAAIDAINRGHVRRYLKKPWIPQELKADVQDALSVYHMQRRLTALESRLRETERVYALGIVAASIGHDLKTPIGWITGNLSFVRDELQKLGEQVLGGNRARLEEVEASLTDTLSGVERLVEIVRSIELQSRGPLGELELVDMADALRLSLRLVSGELRRSASLELDVACAPRVRASSTQLSQVLLNLLVNAIQAVSGRPRDRNAISVRLLVDGDVALLQVADNGPGVAEHERHRIFDPFYTSKPGVGTGLGLAISRKIAEEFHGSLNVGEDERLGGACFSLRLPLAT